jgi:hypothetical protein
MAGVGINLMPKSLWKIWTRSSKEKNSMEVFRRLLKKMDRQAEIISIEPYPKINGYVIQFSIKIESDSWNDQIIEAFLIGQRVASGGALTGNVIDDPGGWSSDVSDSGVHSITWSLR